MHLSMDDAEGVGELQVNCAAPHECWGAEFGVSEEQYGLLTAESGFQTLYFTL